MYNIETLIFTNEKYIDILNITLPRFVKYLKNITNKVNVVTNKLINETNIDFNGVNVFDCNVQFDSLGNHFRDCMLKSLSKINSEYVLFFCDDYMINSEVKEQNFQSILDIIKFYECDFFSFSSLNYCDITISKWDIIETDLNKFGIDGGLLYEISNNYRHLYSVQPCIWKKNSLIELLKYNDMLSISSLDNTNIKNKKGLYRKLNYETNCYEETNENFLDYGFKNLIINYPPFSYNIDDRPIGSDYFVFDYGEILRHGKVIESETNSKKILIDFLEKNLDIKQKIVNFL